MMTNAANGVTAQPPAISPLRTIMLLQQQVKNIAHHAGKVYLTALNAMFMARRVSSKTMAYTRVTTELRKFSRQMDERMQALSTLCSGLTYKIANNSKSIKQKKRMMLALQMTNKTGSVMVANLRKRYEQESHRESNSFSEVQHIIHTELLRINDLIKIGQNLVVLSKVEAMQAEGYTDVLGDISSRIESNLDEIDIIVKDMRQKIA